jgi:hypothetical protein
MPPGTGGHPVRLRLPADEPPYPRGTTLSRSDAPSTDAASSSLRLRRCRSQSQIFSGWLEHDVLSACFYSDLFVGIKQNHLEGMSAFDAKETVAILKSGHSFSLNVINLILRSY